MSNYLVHFTKGTNAAARAATGSKEASDPAYDTMISILGSAKLIATPTGIAKSLAPDLDQQKAVCFSEIPPGEWLRLSEWRKSQFGIGFSKQFISERSGGPILYARQGSKQNAAVRTLMELGARDPANPIWSITPMIDAPGVYGRTTYEYEWEREWRHIGTLKFEPEDVAFLFIPEELHPQARAFFSNAYHENTGPAYFCPFIDAKWSRERVEEELAKGPVRVPPDPPRYDVKHKVVKLRSGRIVSGSVSRLLPHSEE